MNSHQSLLPKLWLWPTLFVVGFIVFLLIPGGFVEKSNYLLHGLCAQNRDHTHAFGDKLLPLDARCAGIYGGVAFSLVILARKGRLLAMQLPARKFLMVLGAFGGMMALDGVNSLSKDLGWWHPWVSNNGTRVITGYGMGILFAVALVWLVAGTVFQIGSNQATIQSWTDIGWLIAPLPVFLAVLESGWTWLYWPLSLFLVGSTWLVIGALALVTILLATKYDERVMSFGHLNIPGGVGLILGVVIMLGLAFGRSWLERYLGIPAAL